MRRVTLFKNGSTKDGKVVLLSTFPQLLAAATEKFNINAKRIFTAEGGEIDDVEVIRDNEILYVSAGEAFIKEDKSTDQQQGTKVPVKKLRLCAYPGKEEQFAVGVSDFLDLIAEGHKFVDKTLIIQVVANLHSRALLVTAPRRFGKSLNLSILKYFFGMVINQEGSPEVELSGKPKNYYIFENLKIGKHKTVMDQMGQYPVINLNLKCSTANNHEVVVGNCRESIHKAYREHLYLVKSKALHPDDRADCELWMRSLAYIERDEKYIKNSLENLSRYLYLHHGRKCFLFVDEYDSICSKIAFSFAIDEIKTELSFVVGILDNAIKYNEAYVQRAFLTGISEICSLGLFGLLNDIDRFTFLDKPDFVPFYGLTRDEFSEIFLSKPELNKTEAASKYNGYIYNEERIYNVWSIAHFVKTGRLDNYWCRTGAIEASSVIFQVDEVKVLISKLLKEDTVTFDKIERVTFEDLVKLIEICKSPLKNLADCNIYMSFLLEQGYLTRVNADECRIEVKIPNNEIRSEFESLRRKYFNSEYNVDYTLIHQCCKHFEDLFINLISGNNENCKKLLQLICSNLFSILEKIQIKKLNESILNHILLDVGLLSRKFNVLSEIYNHDKSGKLDLLYYIDKYCIVIQNKFNRTSRCGLEQIEKKNYINIFENDIIFPCKVESFICVSPCLKVTDEGKEFTIGAMINSVDLSKSVYF